MNIVKLFAKLFNWYQKAFKKRLWYLGEVVLLSECLTYLIQFLPLGST